MTAKSLITVALVSVAAGAALGLLLSPASGKDNRKKLMKKATGAKDALDCLVEEATDRLDEIKKHVRAAKGHAQDLANDARSTVRGATGA